MHAPGTMQAKPKPSAQRAVWFSSRPPIWGLARFGVCLGAALGLTLGLFESSAVAKSRRALVAKTTSRAERPADAGATAQSSSSGGPDAGTGPTHVDAGSTPPSDAGAKPTASKEPPRTETSEPTETPPLPPLPTFREDSSPSKLVKPARGKTAKSPYADIIFESQNHSQAIARRYAQLLTAGRYDHARQLHEEEGGRRPDWQAIRTAMVAHQQQHGTAKDLEQYLVTQIGAELTTFFFSARYADGSELPIRVAIDHHGHVTGVATGPEILPAAKKRYSQHDSYKTKTTLSLPFRGQWTTSNASPNSSNGHFLNANQRFAIDFFITQDVDGKRRSYRDRGKQNLDYFAFGQEILAPADGTVTAVIDGVPDNTPGQLDIYFRLGNTIVLSLGNGEYAYLCHLQNGSAQVRVGDRVARGQVLARCGNSGNSSVPHLHFQLTDSPVISYSASLPAYFSKVYRSGDLQDLYLPMSGDRVSSTAAAPEPKSVPKPDAKSDTKPEAKAEPKSEAKAAAKSEAKSDTKADAKPDAKPEKK